MSPVGPNRNVGTVVASNIYTAILALAFSTVLATAILVAYKCYTQYDGLFKIP